jgi:hypothetical protein
MKKLLPILLAALALPLHAVPVTAEGRAAGDLPNAREIALADALREAVRQGTGLDLLATTEVQNFTLSYDQILGSAFGHIQSYKVLETRLDNIGLGQEVTKATGGRMKLDRSTENLLAFNASGTGSATPANEGDAPASDKPWWKVW